MQSSPVILRLRSSGKRFEQMGWDQTTVAPITTQSCSVGYKKVRSGSNVVKAVSGGRKICSDVIQNMGLAERAGKGEGGERRPIRLGSLQPSQLEAGSKVTNLSDQRNSCLTNRQQGWEEAVLKQ